MPRISVVVPIYNVEPYLDECLDSIAGQTYRDIEVVMVDDGSKDSSPVIAERWVSKDKRFRLVTQPNGGLGNARNTGIKNAGGELLAFVDSDDYLAPNAYQLLVEALDETGSDFATGNVLRLQSQGVRQAAFLAEAFARTRLKTHVSEYRPLIADRIAWNKLFRREFWDKQGREFPEGVLNEDIPVILPAHFAAHSVDVISDPIYYWRSRDSDELSITQRRLEPKALRDRLAAMDQVVDWLDEHGKRKWKSWYYEGIVADDLRLYVTPLSAADDQYRELFLDKVNAFLDRAPKGIYDPLPAIERLRWHLVRRRLMPELLEVLRFQREEMRDRPPVEIRGRWYGDYPFREDERLKIPRSIYLLEGELGLRVEIDSLEWDGERLKVRGNAFIRGIGAATPDTQQLKVVALRRGRLRRVRIRLSAINLDTTVVRRPDATAAVPQRLVDLEWAGFEASLDPSKLRSGGRWRPGVWELFVIVRAGKVHRRRASRFHFNPLRPLRGAAIPLPGQVKAKAIPTASRSVVIDVRAQWAEVLDHRLEGKALELTGEACGPTGEKPRLAVIRRADEKTFKYKMEIDGEESPARFRTRVKLADVLESGQAEPALEHAEESSHEDEEEPEESEDRRAWDLEALGGGPARSVGLAAGAGRTVWSDDGRELALLPTRKLDATLVEQVPRPLVRDAAWSEGGALRLAGELPPGSGALEILLVARDYGELRSVPAEGGGDTFTATLSPARTRSLGGTVPLREGKWDLYARAAGVGDSAPRVPLALSRDLHQRLPVSTVVDHKPFALTATYDDRAVLVVERDLEQAERGQYHQRLMRDDVYVARRHEPLRDAVLYTSFDGRQYSDNPRAIHEELVRRGTRLEQLWVVRDGQSEAPETARAVRELSREWYEALGSARYVVTNDHFPSWFRRRPDQVCLQTWHGAPLKPIGLDVTSRRQQLNPADWEKQLDNWQHVLSPSRFATPILAQAFGVDPERILETGYPRTDLLARPDRDAIGREVRRRLGVAEGKRTVLYAPTFRNRVFDQRGNYRLELRLDLERLRAAIGDDTVLLFRTHPYVVDPVPSEPGGFVCDASSYPDATELLLAADVLVTDYSSIMFDYATTGRPMLFYTYDLDANGGTGNRFYLDYAATVPGPIARTTDELAAALADLDGVRSEYSARYDEFRKRFCDLDDGHAAERVVDRVFVE